MPGEVSAADRSRYEGAKRAIESMLGAGKAPSLSAFLAAADRLGSWDAVTAAVARGENLDDSPSADGKPTPPTVTGEMAWDLDADRDPTETEYALMTHEEASICVDWIDGTPSLKERFVLRERWALAKPEGDARRARDAAKIAAADSVEGNMEAVAQSYLFNAGHYSHNGYLEGLVYNGLASVNPADEGDVFILTPLGTKLMNEVQVSKFQEALASIVSESRTGYGFDLAGARVNTKAAQS